ncbi:hypothetical protein [Hyalangium versicolor]|uniref:hypothetical protein n=1 Tax=Hyalangium versicolor TaxID=2861190 RepID=UPI001CCC5DA8|nr:hypothetical protein [Hyalangium versicolor]
MTFSRLVCGILCSLLPGLALAQLPADAPRNEPLASPPLVPAAQDTQEIPPEEPTPHRSGWHPVARVALETVGGAAGELGGLIAAWPLSLPVDASIVCVFGDDNGDCEPGPRTRGFLVVMFALTAGETLGVYGAGALAGGNGQLLPTIGGSALGTGAALALFNVAQDSNFIPGMAASALLPPLGAILGYELSAAFSHHEAFSQESSRPASGLRLMPVMGRSPRGAPMGGLAGQF